MEITYRSANFDSVVRSLLNFNCFSPYCVSILLVYCKKAFMVFSFIYYRIIFFFKLLFFLYYTKEFFAIVIEASKLEILIRTDKN